MTTLRNILTIAAVALLAACGSKAPPAESPWLARPGGISVQEMDARMIEKLRRDGKVLDAAMRHLEQQQLQRKAGRSMTESDRPRTSWPLPRNTAREGTMVPPWVLNPAHGSHRPATITPPWQQPSAAASARAAAEAARAAARR